MAAIKKFDYKLTRETQQKQRRLATENMKEMIIEELHILRHV